MRPNTNGIMNILRVISSPRVQYIKGTHPFINSSNIVKESAASLTLRLEGN